MFGDTELFNALNVSNITSLLDIYDSKPALWDEPVCPEDFTGDKSINFYFNAPYGSADISEIYSYTVNCRSNSYSGSRGMAYAVQENINQVSFADYYITTIIGQTIPPEDNTDNYNTPITAILKLRG